MKRLILVLAAAALLLAVFAPVALAAGPSVRTGRVLVSVNGQVDVPAGDHLDLLVVADGSAQVSGDVRTIVVTHGTATLTGATAGTVVVVDGTVDLRDGTTVSGDVRTLGGTVTREPGAAVLGSVRTLDADLAALGLVLIPVVILLFIGLGLATIAAALLVAAFASRQVRDLEALIGREPGQVLVSGIAGAIALPLIATMLIVTVVGAPIGLAMLLVALPAIAFLAWIVAAIWIGDWLVGRLRGAPEPGRPYLAAVVGVVVLAFAGVVPFVSGIATLFGFGALLLAALRVLRPASPSVTAPGPFQQSPGMG